MQLPLIMCRGACGPALHVANDASAADQSEDSTRCPLACRLPTPIQVWERSRAADRVAGRRAGSLQYAACTCHHRTPACLLLAHFNAQHMQAECLPLVLLAWLLRLSCLDTDCVPHLTPG